MSVPELTRTFMLSALDHASNDAKPVFAVLKARYEAWKAAKSEQHAGKQAAYEKYLVLYERPRSEYKDAYEEWVKARDAILQEMKITNVMGKKTELMARLLQIPFPDILKAPVPDVYSSHL